jgi:hypothetical protein
MGKYSEGEMRTETNIDRRNEWKKANQRALYKLRSMYRADYERLMQKELRKVGL